MKKFLCCITLISLTSCHENIGWESPHIEFKPTESNQ